MKRPLLSDPPEDIAALDASVAALGADAVERTIDAMEHYRKPTRFFIEYADPDYRGEPSYDNGLLSENATSLDFARAAASKVSHRLNTHVGIYERRNLEQIEAPYGPWHYEVEWVEDGP